MSEGHCQERCLFLSHTHTNTHTTQTHTKTHIHMETHKHKHNTHTNIQHKHNTHTNTYTWKHTDTYTCTHTQIHIHTHKRVYTTHMYIHKYTEAHHTHTNTYTWKHTHTLSPREGTESRPNPWNQILGQNQPQVSQWEGSGRSGGHVDDLGGGPHSNQTPLSSDIPSLQANPLPGTQPEVGERVWLSFSPDKGRTSLPATAVAHRSRAGAQKV